MQDYPASQGTSPEKTYQAGTIIRMNATWHYKERPAIMAGLDRMKYSSTNTVSNARTAPVRGLNAFFIIAFPPELVNSGLIEGSPVRAKGFLPHPAKATLSRTAIAWERVLTRNAPHYHTRSPPLRLEWSGVSYKIGVPLMTM